MRPAGLILPRLRLLSYSDQAVLSPSQVPMILTMPPSHFVRVFVSSSATLTHILIGVKPGSISNPARIWSPPSYDVSVPVEDMPIPPDSVVREVLSEMLNGCGVPFHQLMAIIGSCAACNQVMVLPNILTHPCPGRTKEPGPHPSKYPRLLEDRRVLPTAGSRIKELNAIQGTMGADHRSDNYGDAELVDKVGRKLALCLLFKICR